MSGPDGSIPPLEEIPDDEFDPDRLDPIVGAVMGGQPDGELYRMYVAGELAGRFALSPFDDEGMSTVTVVGVPVARVHYSMLWRGRELDLSNPATLPPERVVVNFDDDEDG